MTGAPEAPRPGGGAASRYAGLPLVVVPQDDGTTRALSAPRPSAAPPVDVVYPVRDGDRLDLLAAAALGSSELWWRIADAGPHADALLLERTGTALEVPRG